MGMTLIGRRVPAGELTAVRTDEARVNELLYGDLDDDEAEMPEPELDLDKAWHGIHYLLTGSSWEVGEGAGAAILGGDPVGEDAGYGPPRILDPAAVRVIASGLDALDVAALRARFDPDALEAAEVYPGIWDEGIEVFDDYLAPNFTELRRFYGIAAQNGEAVLLAIV